MLRVEGAVNREDVADCAKPPFSTRYPTPRRNYPYVNRGFLPTQYGQSRAP
jgi:hypothetical protein